MTKEERLKSLIGKEVELTIAPTFLTRGRLEEIHDGNEAVLTQIRSGTDSVDVVKRYYIPVDNIVFISEEEKRPKKKRKQRS